MNPCQGGSAWDSLFSIRKKDIFKKNSIENTSKFRSEILILWLGACGVKFNDGKIPQVEGTDLILTIVFAPENSWNQNFLSRILFSKFRKKFIHEANVSYQKRRLEFLLQKIPVKCLLDQTECEFPILLNKFERNACSLYLKKNNNFLEQVFLQQRSLWLKSSIAQQAPVIFLWLSITTAISFAFYSQIKSHSHLSLLGILAQWWDFLFRGF